MADSTIHPLTQDLTNPVPKIDKDNERSLKSKVSFSFLCIGLTQLLPWNTILSQFDFFITKQPHYKPGIVYTSIYSTLNLIGQIILILVGSILSYKIQLVVFELIVIFVLIGFPVAPIFFDEKLGFTLCQALAACMGLGVALGNSAGFGLVSYYSEDDIISSNFGQAMAGLGSNILKTAILLITGEKNLELNAFLFFGFAAVISAYSLINLLQLFRNSYFNKIYNAKILLKTDGENLIEGKKEQELRELNSDEEGIEVKNGGENGRKRSYGIFAFVYALIDVNVLVLILYISTFTVFPNALLKADLFSLSMGWKLNIICTLFNLFDAIGRKSLNYIGKTKRTLYFFVIFRLLCVLIVYFTCYNSAFHILNDTFCGIISLLNVSFIGLSSGIATTLCFILGPGQVDNEWKGKAGSCISIFLIVGIALGSYGAYFMDLITTFK